jgi:hypothetical protein
VETSAGQGSLTKLALSLWERAASAAAQAEAGEGGQNDSAPMKTRSAFRDTLTRPSATVSQGERGKGALRPVTVPLH